MTTDAAKISIFELSLISFVKMQEIYNPIRLIVLQADIP